MTLECLAELLAAILAESDSLVAARCLNVLLTKHVPTLLKVLNVGFESSVEFINLLVHHAHFGVDVGDLRMVLPNAVLENIKGPVQVFKALGEVTDVMVVHGQGRIAVTDLRMVDPEEPLLQHDRLRLQLDSLQEVAELELNTCDAANTAGHFFVHSTGDLEHHIDALGVEFESTIKLAFLVELICLSQTGLHITVLLLNLLHVGEEFSDVF